MKWLDRVPWSLLVIAGLTLGLAPFVPKPHLLEKLQMLLAGSLHRPIDIFDLLLHGSAPALLLLRLVRLAIPREEPRAPPE